MEIQTLESVEKFFTTLEESTRAKLVRHLDLLEKFGHLLSLPHSKKLSSNLFELRTRGQQEVRVFYTIKQGQAYLLYGFIKKSQKTPLSELSKAENILKSLDI